MPKTLSTLDQSASSRRRLPDWFKVKSPGSANYISLKRLAASNHLNTVCQSAGCPNITECWERREATFMILGDVCTRSCGFCLVRTGRPSRKDTQEPQRVADAVAELSLRHATVTSVNRDELSDGGAFQFAETVQLIHDHCPETDVEVLIPDFGGLSDALETVLKANPEVLAHNIETVPKLYSNVRPQADYAQSLAILTRSKSRGSVTKTGIMVGLGEKLTEVHEVLGDLASLECDILTIGQYLQPSRKHLPIQRFYTPDEFVNLKIIGEKLGITHIQSGPLVRSSYRAGEQLEAVRKKVSGDSGVAGRTS